MGGYPVYCRGGGVIGGIYDDRFLFNMIQMSVSALGEEVRGPSYEGAKPMLKVCDVDDVAFLKGLLEGIAADPMKKIIFFRNVTSPWQWTGLCENGPLCLWLCLVFFLWALPNP